MSISADSNSANVTLEAVESLSKMGLKTSLGISNISFGLPNRAIINATFLTLALQRGLSCAIINPLSKELMDSYYSFCALSNIDKSCQTFIDYSLENTNNCLPKQSHNDYSLSEIIRRGLINQAKEKTIELIKDCEPIDLINNEIIPALNEVGVLFENGKFFLPQLLNSAEASSLSFAVIKEKIPKGLLNGNAVILATVKGDIHDIGKNIVKLLLESYGFVVYDLGKNVHPESVVEAVKRYNCKLVCLSALMTTTLDAMRETIVQLKNHDAGIKVMVGGAVLTEEIAKSMGADAYGADAMSAVRYAEDFYK